jgi:hypothetical protein
MRKIIFFILFSFFVQASSEAAVGLRRFVLVAGANDGGAERATLRYAVSDARSFARVLEAMGGVDGADIIVLENPSAAAIDGALNMLLVRLSALAQPTRSEIVFYYSGHADENGLLLGSEHLSYETLRQQLDAMPTDVRIAILDACASGAMTRLKGGQRQAAFLVDESNAMRGHAILTSSSQDEAAQESDRIGASFFTHYLVSGMRGAADVSGDGRVSLGEAYRFAFDQTLERTTGTLGGAQHPAYDINLSGTGDVILTDLSQTHSSLLLGDQLQGRIFVRNERQQLVAELTKVAGRTIELGLEEGAYEIHYEHIESLHSAQVMLNSGENRTLQRADFSAVALETTAMRGAVQGAGHRVEYDENLDINWFGQGEYTVSLGFFLNRKRENFHGLQLSLLNIAEGHAGSQFSPLANIGQRQLNGAQLAGVVNIGGPVRRAQLAGVFNAANGPVGYGQAAGVFNVANGPVATIQAAGVANVAEEVGAVQAAGVFNAARTVSYLQAAGVANVAEQVEGLQISGVLNLASHVRGAQVGLVNLSKDIDGITFGLFNYSHTGRLAGSAYVDADGMNWFSFSSGSRPLYSIYSLGLDLTDANAPFAVGFGMGSQGVLAGQIVEVDLSANAVFAKDGTWESNNILNKLRVQVRQKKSGLSPFAGISLDMLWHGKDPKELSAPGFLQLHSTEDYEMGLGAFVGLSYGR